MEDPHKIRAEKHIDDALEGFLVLMKKEQGWTKFGSKSGVVATVIDHSDGLRRVKCTTTINKPFRKIFEFL